MQDKMLSRLGKAYKRKTQAVQRSQQLLNPGESTLLLRQRKESCRRKSSSSESTERAEEVKDEVVKAVDAVDHKQNPEASGPAELPEDTFTVLLNNSERRRGRGRRSWAYPVLTAC